MNDKLRVFYFRSEIINRENAGKECLIGEIHLFIST